MKRLIPIVMLAAMQPVAAAEICSSATNIDMVLKDKYGEKPLFDFVDIGGNHLIMYTNQDAGSWTVLSIAEKGKAYVVDAGTGFTPSVDPLGGKKS